MNNCLKKRGDVGQVSRMVYDRNEWREGVCKGEGLGHSPVDEPLTLTRWYNCGMSMIYDQYYGWKLGLVCG